MKRSYRITGYVLIGLLIGVVLGIALFWVLTRTEFGVERVGRFAVGRLAEEVEGELRVGQVTSEGLLGGLTVHDIAIDDPEGRPFLRVDSARLSYDWRTLVGGRIIFDRLVLYDPEVYIEQLPGDTAWNYEYVFPDTTPDVPGDDRLVLIDRARVVNGLAVIRFPWEPDEDDPIVEPEDTARLILEPAAGGLVRVLRFENIDAVVPRVLWESPVEEGKLFRIASLSTRGYIWEDPFELRELRGAVTIRDSLVAFEVPHIELPSSSASAVGQVIIEDEKVYDVRIEAEDVAFRDVQWLYPRLPEEGSGNLTLRIQTQPSGTLWLATDADLRTPGTALSGSFGIVTGDTLYFTRVDLRASPLDIELLEQVLPVDLPVDGLMVGTVEVEGPISSLTTQGDLRLVRLPGNGEESAVEWSGTLDLRRPFAAQNLRAAVRRLDLALLTALDPSLRLAGQLSGRLEATGRLDRTLRFAGSLRHEAPGRPASTFEGEGVLRTASGRRTVEADLIAQPLALDALIAVLEPMLPGAGTDTPGAAVDSVRSGIAAAVAALTGEARGPIRVRGWTDSLTVAAELDTPAGLFAFQARIDLSGAAPRVRAEGRTTAFRLDRVVDGLPNTALTTRFAFEGTGAELGSATGAVQVRVDAARIGALDVREAEAELRIRDGLAEVERFAIRTDAGSLTVRGGIGLVPGRSGVLRIEAQSDSLAALRPFFFPDTVLVPGTEGDARRVAGRFRLDAEIEGAISAFDAQGTAVFEDLLYDRLAADSATLQVTARGVGTDRLSTRTTLQADSLALYGAVLGRAYVEAEYDGRGGELRVEAAGPQDRTYRLATAFERNAGTLDLQLHELGFGLSGVGWALAEPAAIRASERGIQVNALQLDRTDGAGRVRVDGHLPWRQTPATAVGARMNRPADFSVELEQVRIGEFLRMAQTGVDAGGLLGGRIEVRGVASAPVVVADLAAVDVRYGDTRLDRLAGALRYADRHLDAHLEGLRGGDAVLVGDGRIPIDLALAPVAERRLDQPLRFALRADSLPAALPLSLVDGFSAVEGSVGGVVEVEGTTLDPSLVGELMLRRGAMTWRPSGVRYGGAEGTFRLEDGRSVAVDVTANSNGGRAHVTGTVRFETMTNPTFDLTLDASEFLAARRPDVELTASGQVRLTGSYRRPFISGAVDVDEGALFIDELWRQYQIVDLESPILFDVVDTALVAVRQILPPNSSPFVRNLVIRDATVNFGRDFWLRGRELDAEVTGELTVAYERQAEDLRLAGTLDVLRGTYQLQFAGLPSREFQIREGTVEFVGTPGIDPTLGITATYRVRTAQRTPLDVTALVTGTLQSPRVALTSDAEPPISESDLASYVIFGRPTYLLTSGEARALNRDAVRQLGVGYALGLAATGIESFVQYFGFDYFAITPPDGTLHSAEDGTADSGGMFNSIFGDQLGFLNGTEVEFGRYVPEVPNLFLGLTYRVVPGDGGQPGGRLEWRFDPTWTLELFAEDRFARSPVFGLQQVQANTIFGLLLFREWGY